MSFFVLVSVRIDAKTNGSNLDYPSCLALMKKTALNHYLQDTKDLTASSETDFYKQIKARYGSSFFDDTPTGADSFAYLARKTAAIDQKSGQFNLSGSVSTGEVGGENLYDPIKKSYSDKQNDPPNCFSDLNKTAYFPGNKSLNKNIDSQKVFDQSAALSIMVGSNKGFIKETDGLAESSALKQSFLNQFLSLPEDEQNAYLQLATDPHAFDDTFLSKTPANTEDHSGTFNYSLASFDERKKIIVGGIAQTPCLMMVVALKDQMSLFTNSKIFDQLNHSADPSSGYYSSDQCKKLGDEMWYQKTGKQNPHQDYTQCVEQVQNCEGASARCDGERDASDKFKSYNQNGSYQRACYLDARCSLKNNDGALTTVKLKNVVCKEDWCISAQLSSTDSGRSTMTTNCVNNQFDDTQATLQNDLNSNSQTGSTEQAR